MLEFMLLVAALFFCAGVGMWLCLLAVRAAKILLGRRRRRNRYAVLAAMTQFRMDQDRGRLIDALRRADATALIEIASRLLPLFTPGEREAFETALARRRMARFMSKRMPVVNEGKRLLFCELLGALGSERSLKTLWDAVGDRSPAVRIAAAISLAARGEVSDLRALLDRLGVDARRSARLTYLFDRLLPGRAAEVHAVAGDPTLEPRVRISAYLSLISVSEADYRALVPAMATDPSPWIAAAAARLLLQGPHPDAYRLVGDLLASGSLMVRREATEAAARLGDRRLTPALRHALGDRDPLVHAAAARSMVHLAQGTSPGGTRSAAIAVTGPA